MTEAASGGHSRGYSISRRTSCWGTNLHLSKFLQILQADSDYWIHQVESKLSSTDNYHVQMIILSSLHNRNCLTWGVSTCSYSCCKSFMLQAVL